MNFKYILSETELEIMEILWDKKEFIKTHELLVYFNAQGKNWKRQTLNTFFSRLEVLGLVTRNRSVIKASGTKADYLRLQSKEILDGLYGGDMSIFCAAFTGKTTITEEDRKSLLAMIELWDEEKK